MAHNRKPTPWGALILGDIQTELDAARAKFPGFPGDIIHQAAIVGEESGEVLQAALQITYEHGRPGALRAELIQTAAMVLRMLADHDQGRDLDILSPAEEVDTDVPAE